MTEEEEDQELMEEVKASEKAVTVTRFDASPFYIKSGEMRDYQVPCFPIFLAFTFLFSFASHHLYLVLPSCLVFLVPNFT